MEVFSKYDADEYFNNLKKRIQEEISTLSDNKIQDTDVEEWKDYYFEKWKIQPISLFLDELNPILTEEKVNIHRQRRWLECWPLKGASKPCCFFQKSLFHFSCRD